MKTKLHSATKILTVFLIISILAMPILSTISIKPVFAADVTLPFKDGFESGDFSKWNGGSGGSVTSGSAYNGTYKAVFSSSYRQALFTSTPQDHCFMRAYVRLDNVNASASTSIFGLSKSWYMAEAGVASVSGTLKWWLRYYIWNGTAEVEHKVVSEVYKPVLGKWYCVEVEGKSNSATNAEARMYVDGHELTDVSATGLNNTQQMTYGYLWMSPSNVATVWYDDVVIATSYIGPDTFLTINTVGSGSVSKSPDYTAYTYGTVVTLEATADGGYEFTGWSGDLSGTANPTTITMSSDKTVTATFNPVGLALEVDPATSYVTLEKSFTVNIYVANVFGLTSWQFKLYYDNTVLRCASPTEGVTEGPFLGGPGPNTIFGMEYHNTEGYVLAYCTLKGSAYVSGSGVLATVTFYALADGDTSLHLSDTKLGDTAIPPNPIDHTDVDGTVHVQSFTITVTIVGTDCSVTRDNPGPYHYGETVELTAVHAPGWSFYEWSQDLTGNSNPATLVITGDMTVTATFTEDEYTLTVNINGHGSVSKTPDQATYTYGTVVTLHATPDADWSFQYWTGDPVVGSGDTVTITMNGNHEVTANFLNKPTLQMTPTSKTCRMYHENFVVAITISNAFDVGSFNFEIDYDTTLLDYVSVTWNVWGTGTPTVDEPGGKITFSNSGSPISGTQTLVTITFTASAHHIWKSGAGWTNDLTNPIYFQTISIGYPTGPPLQYSRGDSTQINVGPDFAYTFSPIQGDVDNNGIVNVFDLRTVAAYFDTTNTTYDLVIDGIINVADIYIVTNNFDYHYVP